MATDFRDLNLTLFSLTQRCAPENLPGHSVFCFGPVYALVKRWSVMAAVQSGQYGPSLIVMLNAGEARVRDRTTSRNRHRRGWERPQRIAVGVPVGCISRDNRRKVPHPAFVRIQDEDTEAFNAKDAKKSANRAEKCPDGEVF